MLLPIPDGCTLLAGKWEIRDKFPSLFACPSICHKFRQTQIVLALLIENNAMETETLHNVFYLVHKTP
jgi:hypothetical protein